MCCPSPPNARAGRATARREKVIQAARTAFKANGFHATGIAQIAHASGVAVGQIYRDFANKEAIVAEIETRIAAAARAGHLPAQDASLTAAALIGALHEALVGPLAPDNLDDPAKLRDAVQTLTLMALRAVGVMDARARGLVVQAVLPVTPEPKPVAPVPPTVSAH